MNILRILKNFFENNKSILVSVSILIIVAAGFFWGIIPAGQASWDLFTQNRSLSDEIRALEQKVAVLGSLDQTVLKQNLADVAAAIPTDKALPTLLATLDAMSLQTGAGLTDVTLAGSETIASGSGSVASPSATSVKPVTSPTGANVVKFSASVRGTFDQVQDFLRLSSGVRRLLGIRSFDITLGATSSAQAKFEMETYYVPLPSQIGAVGSKIEAPSSGDNAIIQKLVALPNLTVTAQLPPALIGGPVKANPFAP